MIMKSVKVGYGVKRSNGNYGSDNSWVEIEVANIKLGEIAELQEIVRKKAENGLKDQKGD